jgi:hypothetical protein
MNTFFAIASLWVLFNSTQLPRDKCPIYDAYPEQIFPEDEEFPEEEILPLLPPEPVIPKGNWFCWAIECPGHQFKVGGLGCKMNIIEQFAKAIFERVKFSFKP